MVASDANVVAVSHNKEVLVFDRPWFTDGNNLVTIWYTVFIPVMFSILFLYLHMVSFRSYSTVLTQSQKSQKQNEKIIIGQKNTVGLFKTDTDSGQGLSRTSL